MEDLLVCGGALFHVGACQRSGSSFTLIDFLFHASGFICGNTVLAASQLSSTFSTFRAK